MKKVCLLFLLPVIFLLSIRAQENKKIEIPNGYSKLVFHDEFNGEGLPDESKWSYEKGYLRNGEMQYYTVGRKENCFQKNGFLNIVALNDSAEIDGKVRPVTSTSITTKDKHSWTYCRVEMRAKLPMCLGTWPAVWMMPNADKYGEWPKSGEIDIMEYVGYQPGVSHSALHTRSSHGATTNKKQVEVNDLEKGFHIYGINWDQDKIEFYIDHPDAPFYVYAPEKKTPQNWAFDKPHYILFNLAVGGNWGGKMGIDNSIFPQDFRIDWVRVYSNE